MPTLADIMSFIDARKRTLANTARDVYDDPVGGAKLAGTRMIDMLKSGAQNQLNAAGNMQSVMPGGVESGIDQLLAGPLGMAQLGLTAWHGSPHIFDKFDSSKIGTGEGLQVEGKGHYLAEEKEVGRGYRERLSGANTTLFDLGGSKVGYIGDAKRALIEEARKRGYSPESAALVAHELQKAQGSLEKVAGNLGWSESAIGEEAARLAREMQYVPQGGALYKVDVPDEHVANMLHLDKALQSQPKYVQDAVFKIASDPNSTLAKNMAKSGIEVQDLMHGSGRLIRDMLGDDASAVLRAAGIPGSKYFDEHSRIGPKTPIAGGWHDTQRPRTHNFVMFDDEIPKIIGRE